MFAVFENTGDLFILLKNHPMIIHMKLNFNLA